MRRQKLMEIFVTDKCSGEEPFPTITVEMDKKSTLAELKAAIISKFPLGLSPFAYEMKALLSMLFSEYTGLIAMDAKYQLRRSLPASGEGNVYTDESRTLEEVGIKDADRVIIEYGAYFS